MEEDQRTISYMTKLRKPLEAKNKPYRTSKRPSYIKYKIKQVVSDNPRQSRSHKRKRVMINPLYDCVKTNSSAMERAEEVQANLATEHPSFVKSMLPSHVTGGFWLGLPKQFCNLHLPRHDIAVILVDESEEEYKTKYLVEKNGLSGGWRGFSIAHKLLEGDVLVFQLVKSCKFKVYIVRANGLAEVDGALGLLNLEACAKQMEFDHAEKDTKTPVKPEEKCLESLSLDIPKEDIQRNSLMVLSTKPVASQSENDSEDIGSEILEGIKFSVSIVDFKEVKSIENFAISVNGLIIDSEISGHLRTKYYELCCSQNSYLHDHLLEGINCKLAAGIICETINIADAIKACKLTVSQDNIAIWDKTLKAFEELGMNVGFLRAQLGRLVKSKRYSEARLERVQAEEEMRTLEAKLLEVKGVVKRLDDEIEALKVNADRHEMFQEEVNGPW